MPYYHLVSNEADITQQNIMYTADTIKEAIGRSISHNEIARVEVADQQEALAAIDNDENVSDVDHAVENNGDLDVWGERMGKEFRIRICKA